MTHAVRIGCSGWNYKSWREPVYERAPASRWLELYADRFDTVEVNASFYRLPTRQATQRWAEQTPEGFCFALKASRYLTHIKRLTNLSEGIRALRGVHRAAARGRQARAATVAAAGVVPPRRRSPGRRARGAAAGPARLRVPPPELVRRRRRAAAAGARRRAGRRRRPPPPLPDPAPPGELDLRPLPPRPRARGRLLHGRRARDVGAPHRPVAPRRRRLRLLQQRLGGLRGAQRGVAGGAAGGCGRGALLRAATVSPRRRSPRARRGSGARPRPLPRRPRCRARCRGRPRGRRRVATAPSRRARSPR